MPISDITYIACLPVVVLLFYSAPIAIRPILLLLVSYAYYLTFPIVYLPILLGITATAFFGGLVIERYRRSRHFGLLVGALIAACFVPMFCYKLIIPWLTTGLRASADWGLTVDHLPIPVGLSFYTFAAVGYLVDVALGVVAAERQVVKLGLFCGFFASATQGPIPRADNLADQFKLDGRFDIPRVEQAFREILLGLILKRIFAEAFYGPSQLVYSNLATSSPLEHLVGTIYFAFQVYVDWMGYTLIAVGSARLLGIDLPQGFRQPYLATSSVEFWRSWNATLVDWLHDYVFVPLNSAARSLGSMASIVAMVTTFILLGVWHAAGWGFVVYGVVNGLLVTGSRLTAPGRDRAVSRLGLSKTAVRWWRIGSTFFIHTLVLILVRASNLGQAIAIYSGFLGIFLPTKLTSSPDSGVNVSVGGGFHYISFDYRLLLIAAVVAGDLIARHKLVSFSQVHWVARVALYAIGVAAVAPVMIGSASKAFLYFQF
jgi:alginate O-acetyltransferase complex protein AlgI